MVGKEESPSNRTRCLVLDTVETLEVNGAGFAELVALELARLVMRELILCREMNSAAFGAVCRT